MKFEERLKLAERNSEEIITRDELRELVEEKTKPSAYVGYEPSGKIHLGHMIAIDKLIDLQKAGFDITVLLADLHAYLNQKGSLKEIGRIAEYNKECFIGMGLSPKRTSFILGSKIQLTKEYFLNVQRLALETTLLRARRSMDMIGREEKSPKVARTLYPLMQVIDIVTLGIDVAVGGMDQRKIHMLARDNLPKLGYKAPVCIHLPLIQGLDGTDKMSSSKENFISVDDTEEEIRKKINKAYCPPSQARNNPLLEIFKTHIFGKIKKVIVERPKKFGGDIEFESYGEMEKVYIKDQLHPLDIKNACSEYLIEILSPVKKHLKKRDFLER